MCRSRSRRLSPTKRLFRSPTRPIPAAAPRMKASTLLNKSYLSYKPSNWLLPTKPPLSWFLQKGTFTLPPQCCSVMPPIRVAVLVPAGDHSARQQHRPAAARRPASTSQSPWARVVADESLICFSFSPYPPTTHAQCGFMVIESPYFSESLMKGRRACRTS